MKKLLSSLLVLSVVSSQFAIQARANSASNGRVGQMILELDKSNQAIEKIKEQLAQAKSMKSKAMWIGIPVTVGATLFAAFAGFASSMATTGSDPEASAVAGKSLKIAGVAAVGTGYMIHIKNEQIGELESLLDSAVKRNNRAKQALAAIEE